MHSTSTRSMLHTAATVAVGILITTLLAACTTDEPTADLLTPTATTTPPASTPKVPPEATVTTPEPTADPTSRPLVLRFEMESFALPAGARPHDVAPAVDGGVWYTAQCQAALGHLDPATGEVTHIALGAGAAPHGVIVGPDGHAWITDGGLNAIVRVHAETHEVMAYPLPEDRGGANLNTAAFDGRGRIWFTGQSGIIGVLDPATEEMQVFDAPRGRGPYGIDATPDGEVWIASLAGSYLARVDLDEVGEIEVLEPPTANAGVRRVWSDSVGRLWIAEWNAGQVGVYDPINSTWQEWPLPAENAQAYAVYVDELDAVWLSDFGSNTIVRFDPETEEFESFTLAGEPSQVRQILGRPGEVWFPESAADILTVIRFSPK